MSERIEIVITPSAEQYRRLCHDLETLRVAGADSNTAAVLAAVHQAAHNAPEAYDGEDKKMPRQRKDAPGPEPRR